MTVELAIRLLVCLVAALLMALMIVVVVYKDKDSKQEKRIAFLERRLESSRKEYDTSIKIVVKEYDDAMRKMAKKIKAFEDSRGK